MTQRLHFPFHLLVKPIGPLCNIRCDYCFYLEKEMLFGHEKRSDYIMSDEVLETFTRQYIEAQPEGIPEVNFAWQGGEPTLLPLSFFDKALEYQRKYSRPGMHITNAIQTNGTLISREKAAWLAEHKFLVGISIDGDESLHNKYRRDKDGKGTFSRVMSGIENLKSAGTQFNTLTVVQNDNAEYPERIYDFLKSIGSDYLQFIPIVEPLPDGSVSTRTVSPEQWGRFMNGVFDKWVINDIGKVFVQHFDMLLGLHAGYPSSLCVHSVTCGNAMALEHDGTVYSCDHFVTKEDLLGNIVNDDIGNIINGEHQAAFGRSKRDNLPNKCLNCRWLSLCNGGCMKDRLIPADGGLLNYLCSGYSSFYSHTEPYFQAMAKCLQQRLPPSGFRQFFVVADKGIGRNDPCPCMSGKKYKHCHGAA